MAYNGFNLGARLIFIYAKALDLLIFCECKLKVSEHGD